MIALVLCWTLAVAVTISAARTLVVDASATMGIGPLASLAGSLPAVPMVDGYTATLPMAWLVGATISGSLLGLTWMLRVRKVTITPGMVGIHRGLRPWPRRYPRPPYEKVIVMDRSVHIGKATGLNLLNPSASPMLKADEAQWVAYEMRRALKETR